MMSCTKFEDSGISMVNPLVFYAQNLAIKWLFVSKEPVAVVAYDSGMRCSEGDNGNLVGIGAGGPGFYF